jgi:hypothetical protein
MDLLIVGRFRAVSTPSSGGAMCKSFARLDLAKDSVFSRIGGVPSKVGAYRSETLEALA